MSEAQKKLYRQYEFNRVKALLLAQQSVLVVGEEGSGKTFLGVAIQESLQKNYTVAYCEPATPKNILIQIADQYGISIYNERTHKMLSAEKIQTKINSFFTLSIQQGRIPILIVDDAHMFTLKFRTWFKDIKKQKIPILLLATNPPRKDIFINLPRLIFGLMSLQGITEIIEARAKELELSLTKRQISEIIKLACGNPTVAIRCVEEIHFGFAPQEADHQEYLDITPLLIIVLTIFVVIKMISRGINDPTFYFYAGICGYLVLGLYQFLMRLPGDNNRIN